MIKSGLDYVRELEALQRSPEWELYQRLRAIDFSFRLHATNCRELLALLDAIAQEKVALQIWDQTKRDVLEAVLEEATRLLHNFVASAKSLVDHTRAHVRSLYGGTEFEREYEARTRRLSSSPVQRFIQGLRNYVQHYRLPAMGAQLRFEGDTVESGLRLEINKLRVWNDWHRVAEEYLSQYENWVPLRAPVEEYMAIIADHYEWLYQREEEMHSRELTKMRKRHAELNRFWEASRTAVMKQIEREQQEEAEREE